MPQITDYTATSAHTATALAINVATLINRGWQPFGSIAVTLVGGSKLIYAQALVKYAA